MTPRATRFDDQAAGFDERAGVGPAAATVAEAIEALGGRGTVLEVGPGTGEIGVHLAVAASRYVGLDASFAMLEVFAGRKPSRALLVLADAAGPWPVRDGSVDVVFSSRAAHLLDTGHVAAEIRRVSQPGGTVLIGRVQRPPDGLRARLRERRRALLAEGGVEAPEGRDRTRRLLQVLVEAGAAPIECRSLASWTVTTAPGPLLDQWESASAVGRTAVPPDVHAAVMARLRAEAPAKSVEEIETYTIQGVRLPTSLETT